MARSEQFVAAAAAAAAAALPALLPTPPRSKMLPLLPTPCLVILPASFASSPSKPKPGRADTVERWDVHKPGGGGVSPPTERRGDRGRGLSRADACDRWDSNKTASPSRSSSSSSSSSSEPFRRGSSSRSPARSSSSRASSAERRDIHNKPRLETQAGVLASEKDRNAATTMSPKTEEEIRKPWWYNESKRFAAEAPTKFAGPSFASPEPCMLPLPNFLKAH